MGLMASYPVRMGKRYIGLAPPIADEIAREYRRRSFPTALTAVLTLATIATAMDIGGSWPHPQLDARTATVALFWIAAFILMLFFRWSATNYPWILGPVSVAALFNIFRTADVSVPAGLESLHLRLFATFVFVTVLFRLPYRVAAVISLLSYLYCILLVAPTGQPMAFADLASLGGVILLSIKTLYSLESRERNVFIEKERRRRDLEELEHANAAFAVANAALATANTELQRVGASYENAHRAAITQLDQQTRETRTLIAEKTQFIKKAAHNLRNSVSGIENYLETTRKSFDRRELAAVDTQLQKIAAGTHTLSTRIHQILSFTRLDAVSDNLNLTPVDLGRLLGDIERELAPRAMAKSLELRIQRPRTPIFAESDEKILWQVLSNLVSNAIKFTYSRRASGLSAVGGVSVGAVRLGSRIQVNVWDTGIGIPSEQLDRIWRPHERLVTKIKEEGDGLGLAIVEAAVRQLPGHAIFVSSHVGRGTHFRLDLPPCGAPELLQSSDIDDHPAAADASQVTRLVLLEDDDFVRRSQEELLAEWGATFLGSGSNVDEVIALLSRSEEIPDAIVSDFDLGHQTGAYAIECLRAKYDRCIPALVVTGCFEDAAAALQTMENVRLFAKPVKPAKLRQALDGLLRQQ